jgi:hypothetical protein
MNIRSRVEREVLKGLEQQSSLTELILLSPASRAESNEILAEILNHQSHKNAIRVTSKCCPISARAKAA